MTCWLTLLVVACTAAGCGSGAKAAGALGNVAIGLTASGMSRTAGGCYAVCTGTDVCDVRTGLCEPNPCGPGCGTGNRCDLSGPLPRCVAEQHSTTDLLTSPLPPKTVQ